LDDSATWTTVPETLATALQQEMLERDTVVEDAIKALFLLKHKSQSDESSTPS